MRDERVIGVDVGGTKVLVAALAGGQMSEPHIEPTQHDSPDALLDQLVGAIERVAGGDGAAAVGLGVPSVVDWETGRVRSSVNIPLADVALREVLADRLGLPVFVDNDASVAALAEAEATGARHLVMLTIGTGVGGGALIDGHVLQGLGHPEMGHVTVPRQPGDDYPGACPFHRGDCLEGMASGPAIAQRWGRSSTELRGADRRRAVELEAAYLAIGIRNIVYAIAPEAIVIGGGVSRIPGFFPAVRAAYRSIAGYPGLSEHRARGFIRPAGLGQRAGALGALLLARQAVESSP